MSPLVKQKEAVLQIISEIKVLVVNDELFILESLQEIMKGVGIKDVDRA